MPAISEVKRNRARSKTPRQILDDLQERHAVPDVAGKDDIGHVAPSRSGPESPHGNAPEDLAENLRPRASKRGPGERDARHPSLGHQEARPLLDSRDHLAESRHDVSACGQEIGCIQYSTGRVHEDRYAPGQAVRDGTCYATHFLLVR